MIEGRTEGRLDVHSSRRLPALDGVRGLAIASVLLWHFLVVQHVLQPEGPKPAGMMPLVHLLSLTWAGVDLFFVLSGFLIAGVLLDRKGSPFFLGGFYIRRCFRIYPIYWTLMAVCVVVPFLAARLDLAGPWAAYAVLLQNFWMADHRRFGGDPMGVTWSLAIEEQFYLVLPAIVLALRRPLLALVLAAAVVAAPVARYAVSAPPGSNWMAAYVLTLCRADALALGALLAIVARRRPDARAVAWAARVTLALSAVGVAALIANGDTIGTPAMNVIGYTVLAFAGASLIGLVVASPDGLVGRTMQSRALREAGAISYGLYLIHTPILMICRAYLRVAPVPTTWPAAVYAFAVPAVISVALAAASWHLLEHRLVRFGHRLGSRPR